MRDIPDDVPQATYVPLTGTLPGTNLQLLVQLMVNADGTVLTAHASTRRHRWETWSPPAWLDVAP
jgi:hypothetical protein